LNRSVPFHYRYSRFPVTGSAAVTGTRGRRPAEYGKKGVADTVSKRFDAGGSRFRRGLAIAMGLIAAGGLSVFAAGAGAAPQPTVDQVQARIDQLTSQFDQVSEQLDQASQQLSAAQSKLSQVRVRLSHANTQFQAAQANMAQSAAAAFEDAGATSIAGVLTSGDPSVVLQQGSLLTEQSGNRKAETKQLLTDASQLAGVEQEVQRTESGIASLKSQLAGHKNSLGKLISTEKATLASLTVPQQQTVQSNSIGASGSSAPQPYTGPTSTQAGKAVAFAYAQLGKPYQWGATGPGSFDCSGLTQAAWAAAGVSIPRTTYAQWAALPHIATSAIQPGDLLYYDGEGHVAMYVGGGYIIDAPQTGMDVQKLPMNTGWYASTFDGAVRP
jgi:cell wall-associated NlpC family hydrolase